MFVVKDPGHVSKRLTGELMPHQGPEEFLELERMTCQTATIVIVRHVTYTEAQLASAVTNDPFWYEGLPCQVAGQRLVDELYPSMCS